MPNSSNTLTEPEIYVSPSTSTLPPSAFLSMQGRLAHSTPPIVVRLDPQAFGLPLPSWFRPTLERIVSLLNLPASWDSYDALPLDPKVADSCLNFLEGQLGDSTPIPQIVPTVHGGLQVEWHQRGVDLEITWDPTDEARVYGCASGEEWEGALSTELGRIRSLIHMFKD